MDKRIKALLITVCILLSAILLAYLMVLTNGIGFVILMMGLLVYIMVLNILNHTKNSGDDGWME